MSMTENEAKHWLKHTRAYQHKCDNCEYIDIKGACNEECKDFYDIAIQALEEIQEYRAIGTVDECAEMQVQYNYLSTKIKKYEAIGTIEEFKALKEADMRGANRAVDEFANYLHNIAKENNGLRLSSETKSWTHPCIFDYLEDFKNEQTCKAET
jgi:hypothetical protein